MKFRPDAVAQDAVAGCWRRSFGCLPLRIGRTRVAFGRGNAACGPMKTANSRISGRHAQGRGGSSDPSRGVLIHFAHDRDSTDQPFCADRSTGQDATEWHPLLVAMLRFALDPAFRVEAEVSLGKPPLRVDILLVRREGGKIPEAACRTLRPWRGS